MNIYDNDFERAQALQYLLICRATGVDCDYYEYINLRKYFFNNTEIKKLLPSIVRVNRNLDQFWEFIKNEFSTYSERRKFIYSEFVPLLDHLENKVSMPADDLISDVLKSFDEDGVHSVWSRALERRKADPEGAITMARTLIETVCKHILENNDIEYDDGIKLTALYKLTAKELNLSPSQHSQIVFKQILGGCSSIVNGLGNLRNKLSDAHGQGSKAVKPAPRHAELAVNLAGSVALFLIETYKK